MSSRPKLRRLHLARLEKLPDWIPNLECLVKIRLGLSKLKDDPMQSLKNLPNLLKLSLWENAYDGENLHFQDGVFQKLKELILSHLNGVNHIHIEKGALLSLEYLKLVHPLASNTDKLKAIDLVDMPNEFVKNIDPNEGHGHWIIKHVSIVFIRQWFGPKFYDYEQLRILRCLASIKRRYLSSDQTTILLFIFTIPNFFTIISLIYLFSRIFNILEMG